MNPESINHTEKSENTSSESSKWNILTKYDEDERARVDKIKSEYFGGNIEEEPEVISPSTLKKMGRLVLDNLNITIPAVERQRNREAESIAMKELRDEQQKKAERVRKNNAESDEETELRRIDKGLRDFADSIKSEEIDKEQLAGRIADIRKEFDVERYNTARAQELLERDINASVVKIDELETLASGGYEGVEKTTEKYNEDIIPVYNLKGYPCEMLVHSVGYKIHGPGEERNLREDLAERAVEDPSFWTKKKGEVEGGSNLLCTSYVNLSTFPGAFVHDPPIYGFSKIRANSTLLFTNGDGKTGTDWHADPSLESFAVKGIPTHIRPGAGYNELTIKRYSDDDGEPLLPDYIVTENGEITDIDRKHAAYFKIPIVNIEQQYYKDIDSGEKNGTTD